MRTGDIETAKTEFCLAFDDPDPYVQRIARNRVMELFPEQVFVSTHGDLYHRPNCPAKNIIRHKRLKWFAGWNEAERADFTPCGQCKPPRP
jgi:methylphosphotriester-DNA--protein-cysteine methyltransferase